jgi:hypothetical protein
MSLEQALVESMRAAAIHIAIHNNVAYDVLPMPSVTAEVASSSLVVPATPFQTLTENAPSWRGHKKVPKRHNLN